MKKIIALSCSLIIMIIMIGNIIGILAEEADTFNITIGDVVVSPSSKIVELPVHVGCQDLSAMTMELEFSKGLRFIGVNSNLNGISKNLNENLILYTSFISSKNKLDLENEFLNLVFELPDNVINGDVFQVSVKADENGKSVIDASDSKLNLIDPVVKNGSIVVAENKVSLTIDSMNVALDVKEIEVPVRIDSQLGLMAINAQFSVNNGAEILDIYPVNEDYKAGFEYNNQEKMILWSPLLTQNISFSKEVPFVMVKIKLPEIANAGDEYIVENTYFDASDKSFNTISLENKPQGIVKLKSEVTVKIHEVIINSKEEFDALKTVKDYRYLMIKEGYENKKVVEVPIEIVKNNGMYICKNKINLSNGVEIVGYKEKKGQIMTLPNSSISISSDLQTLIWSREGTDNSKDTGIIATALIAIDSQQYVPSLFNVEIEINDAQYSTYNFNDNVLKVENGSIVIE